MAGVHTAVKVRGLDEFRREIKKVDKEFGKELRQVHLAIAKMVAGRAQAAAPARVTKAIRPRATQKSAFVQTRTVPPYALGVFWGMRRRSGWYAAHRYRGSSGRQFEPWVGNQWDPGETGGQPYFIGPAINDSVDEVIDMYGDAIEKLAGKAFPD